MNNIVFGTVGDMTLATCDRGIMRMKLDSWKLDIPPYQMPNFRDQIDYLDGLLQPITVVGTVRHNITTTFGDSGTAVALPPNYAAMVARTLTLDSLNDTQRLALAVLMGDSDAAIPLADAIRDGWLERQER